MAVDEWRTAAVRKRDSSLIWINMTPDGNPTLGRRFLHCAVNMFQCYGSELTAYIVRSPSPAMCPPLACVLFLAFLFLTQKKRISLIQLSFSLLPRIQAFKHSVAQLLVEQNPLQAR